jgi:uncharacterized protein (TIGR02588 family)
MTDSDQRRTKNPLEWTVFGLSTLLVLVTVGMLAMAAFRTDAGPAQLRVTTGKPMADGGWVTIPVTVRNDGGEVAENVEIRVCVGEGEARREAGFTVDYVPREAERKGAVSFRSDGRDLQPRCEILGYNKP